MAINKKYVPTCDMCGDTLAAELSIDDAIDAMHCEGWETKARDGGWWDYCCECWEREIGAVLREIEEQED